MGAITKEKDAILEVAVKEHNIALASQKKELDSKYDAAARENAEKLGKLTVESNQKLAVLSNECARKI